MLLKIKIHRGGNREALVLINVKKQAISVAIDEVTVYTFDLKGRLVRAVINGHSYSRSLRNEILEKYSGSHNGKKYTVRLWLNMNQKSALIEEVRDQMWQIFSSLERNHFDLIENSAELAVCKKNISSALERILQFDMSKLEKDAREFDAIYDKVGILPPDMYFSVLLQATRGCSYNLCNFCNLYKDQKYHIKSEAEFKKHIEQVKLFFGDSISLRKKIFLGEGNALDMPFPRLQKFFTQINESFNFKTSNAGIQPDLPVFEGISSFISAFQTYYKGLSEFEELKSLHLERVYIGMETGCQELLHVLNKPTDIDTLIEMTNTVKKSGLKIGIIILLGAGGKEFYEKHINETRKALHSLNFEKNDVVFFSPLVVYPRNEYARFTGNKQIRALNKQEILRQKDEIIQGFSERLNGSTPKVGLYDIESFIY